MRTSDSSKPLSVLAATILFCGCADELTGATNEGSTGASADGSTSSVSTTMGPPSTTTMAPTTADGTAADDAPPMTDDGVTDDGTTAGDDSTSGTGATETDGTGTTGEPSDCAQVTIVGDLVPLYPAGGPQAFRLTGQLLGDAGSDRFYLEFFANGTGSFDLAAAPNDNYGTCDQCVRVLEDYMEEPQVFYFPEEGTLEVDAATPPQGTSLIATLTGVRLVEVTIARDFTSTPVVDGACVEIADVTIEAADVEDWTCNPVYYAGDNGCDCGCGLVDPDCVDATVDACDFCDDAGSCGEGGGACPGDIDPSNNAACI